MITKTLPEVSRSAHIEISVLVALQNINVMHGYFTGFEGAETAARRNWELKAYSSCCGKLLVIS